MTRAIIVMSLNFSKVPFVIISNSITSSLKWMNAIIREIITSETLQELPLKSPLPREVRSKESAYKGVCYNKNS